VAPSGPADSHTIDRKPLKLPKVLTPISGKGVVVANRNLRQSTLLVLLVLADFTLVLGGLAPSVGAVVCQLEIISIDVTSKAALGENLRVDTHLRATCTATNDELQARVDIASRDSNDTLSRETVILGMVATPKKVTNTTVTSSIRTPLTSGNWRLEARAWIFAVSDIVASTKQSFEIRVGAPVQTETAQQEQSSESTGSLNSLNTVQAGASASSNNVEAGLLVLGLAIVSIALVIIRHRKRAISSMQQTQIQQSAAQQTPCQNRPTGYDELDTILEGGLPAGYAVLTISPPSDERDLLLRKIMTTTASEGNSILLMTRELGKTRDLVSKYQRNFFVLSPHPSTSTSDQRNVLKITGIVSLSDLNISFNKAMENIGDFPGNKVLIIDIISDILLEHGAPTTRKWLDDFIAKRKSEGFTIIGALNPQISSKQESQTIDDLFDGLIEIYEKETEGRPRRFLIVRRMYGRRYAETELMLSKDKLF
jgi:KaiC/GvpD/RAD55 family RecA-like ATPase